MGKNITAQKRGRGSPRYRVPSFNYRGKACHLKHSEKTLSGKIDDIVHCAGHSAPLAEVSYENGDKSLIQAPEGIRVGDSVSIGSDAQLKAGNTLPLKKIPEGTSVYNIEIKPGDGGKFCRASGSFAKIVSKIGTKVTILLPSKKEKEFEDSCRAIVGTIAGSGRTEKPFLKAGKKYFAMKARNRYWPSVSATSMNAVAHPFGGRSSCRHKMPLQSSRNAPPGRKVGSIAPRRSGRKKR